MNFEIIKYESKYVKELSTLISDTILQTNHKFTKNSLTYFKFYKLDISMKKNHKEYAIDYPITLLAINNNEIIGAISGKLGRINKLFVKQEHQKKGVGKQLVQEFEKINIENNQIEIKVGSMLNSSNFYEKLNYLQYDEIRNMREPIEDIEYIPMKKVLE